MGFAFYHFGLWFWTIEHIGDLLQVSLKHRLGRKVLLEATNRPRLVSRSESGRRGLAHWCPSLWGAFLPSLLPVCLATSAVNSNQDAHAPCRK